MDIINDNVPEEGKRFGEGTYLEVKLRFKEWKGNPDIRWDALKLIKSITGHDRKW
jgi:hypothetical protein